jgi:hypothetical protein
LRLRRPAGGRRTRLKLGDHFLHMRNNSSTCYSKSYCARQGYACPLKPVLTPINKQGFGFLTFRRSFCKQTCMLGAPLEPTAWVCGPWRSGRRCRAAASGSLRETVICSAPFPPNGVVTARLVLRVGLRTSCSYPFEAVRLCSLAPKPSAAGCAEMSGHVSDVGQ